MIFFFLSLLIVLGLCHAGAQPTPATLTSSMTDYLTHFWQFNNNVKDSISQVSLFDQHSASKYVADRLGRANSALWLNKGYIRMPVSFYFAGSAYSTSLWIYKLDATSSSYVYNLQNTNTSPSTNFVRLSVSASGSFVASFGRVNTNSGTDGILRCLNSAAITRRWTHVGITYDGYTFACYVNGSLANSVIVMSSLVNVTRVNSYIGSGGAAPLNAYLDDVMFFTRGLLNNEMLSTLYNYYETMTTTSTRTTKRTTSSTKTTTRTTTTVTTTG